MAPPADPAAAQPKPDYSAYGYGAYGKGFILQDAPNLISLLNN